MIFWCTSRPFAGLFYVLVIVTLSACARSGTLESDDLDCAPGTRVFFQFAGHCVYPRSSAPELCPGTAPYRYELSAELICSEDPELRREATVEIGLRGRGLFPVDSGIPPMGGATVTDPFPGTVESVATTPTDEDTMPPGRTDSSNTDPPPDADSI